MWFPFFSTPPTPSDSIRCRGALLGLLQHVVGLLQLYALLSGHQLLHRRHDGAQPGLAVLKKKAEAGQRPGSLGYRYIYIYMYIYVYIRLFIYLWLS